MFNKIPEELAWELSSIALFESIETDNKLYLDADKVREAIKGFFEGATVEHKKHWLYSSEKNPKFLVCSNCGATYERVNMTGWKGCPMCLTVLVDRGVIRDE